MSYHQKYLKYKQKYLDLKKSLNMAQLGGARKPKKNSLDIDDISVLTESPNDVNVYGYELKGGADVDSEEIRTTTTIEDIVGGGEESLHEEAVETNSSIETSSIEGLDEISSLKDSSVERNESLDINDLSEMTAEQKGGSEVQFGVVSSDNESDSSSSKSSDSELESLDSDTSDSD